jgi:N-acetylneuraminic acid mutarotase
VSRADGGRLLATALRVAGDRLHMGVRHVMRRSYASIAAAVLVVVVSACSDSAGTAHESATTIAVTPPPTSVASVSIAHVAVAPWKLAAPVAREVVVTDGQKLTVVGGLDATKFSTAAIVRVDPTTGASQPAGTLGEAVHDAAGVQLGNRILVFGGGGPSENGTPDVQSLSANAATTTVIGKLPHSRSDHVAVTVGATVYVLGGYDGTSIVADVVSTTDGVSFTKIGVLPVPVRYPAVAVIGQSIYLFGGVSDSRAGIDTTAVQRLDTATGTIEVVAQLPTPLSHASAVVLANRIFVLGGYINNTKLSDQILRFDPTSATTVAAGHLPAPISDAAATVIHDHAYLIGGQGTDRAPLATVTVITAP